MNTEKMIEVFGLTPYKAAALKDILGRDITYIDDASFSEVDAESKLFNPEIEVPTESNWKGYKEIADKGGLDAKGKQVLLTKEQEYILFRQYNFAKKRVSELKQELEIEPKHSTINSIVDWNKKAFALRSLLVELNLRLVVDMVKKFSIYKLDADELHSDANLALLASVDGFDAARNGKFSTYAYWSIVRSFGKVNKGRSKRMDMAPISLSEIEDDNATEMCSSVAVEKHESEDAYCREMLIKIIEKNLAGLSDIELNVIKHRYLHNNKRPSISEVSEKLQVKSHQVDKSEKAALAKIRAVIEKNL